MIKHFNPERRRFLQVGLIGSALLATAAGGIILSRKPESCQDCLWLQQDDLAFLQALVPVILAGALPTDKNEHTQAINEIISGFDLTVSHFTPGMRTEIRQLLWLVEFPLTRPLLTGIWFDWDKSEVTDISKLLKRWQHSRFDLLRVAYAALHDLITGAWYANPLSWQRIHYPGPPALI